MHTKISSTAYIKTEKMRYDPINVQFGGKASMEVFFNTLTTYSHTK